MALVHTRTQQTILQYACDKFDELSPKAILHTFQHYLFKFVIFIHQPFAFFWDILSLTKTGLIRSLENWISGKKPYNAAEHSVKENDCNHPLTFHVDWLITAGMATFIQLWTYWKLDVIYLTCLSPHLQTPRGELKIWCIAEKFRPTTRCKTMLSFWYRVWLKLK